MELKHEQLVYEKYVSCFFHAKKGVPCMGYASKDVEKTKKIAKKFVRYQEGAELYSIGLTKFQELAKEAKAVYKIDKVALVNCEIFEKYLETFRIA